MTEQNKCREGADLSRLQIVDLLSSEGARMERLMARAVDAKRECAGEGIYLRGLIEYSNVCRKNCLYCGIRRDVACDRYTLTPQQVLEAARFSLESGYGSVVLQGGENTSPEHIAVIEQLLRDITRMSDGQLGITISFGEQHIDTYRRWREAGAHRYLLRIEASNSSLYGRLHPADTHHTYDMRIKALDDLRQAGYMVGTGVMVGVPGQTLDDLAGDLLFMKGLDIDMCGMGPYVESRGTPLAESAQWPVYGGDDPVKAAEAAMSDPAARLGMTLRMTALLRLLMPDINIAAATALEAIDPRGREKAIAAGANVVMLNVTPDDLRPNYALYDNKPFSPANFPFEADIRFGHRGDPRHFKKRTENK